MREYYTVSMLQYLGLHFKSSNDHKVMCVPLHYAVALYTGVYINPSPLHVATAHSGWATRGGRS